MKICVVSSCGKKKIFDSKTKPDCSKIPSKKSLDLWRYQLSGLTTSAREMYIGYQQQALSEAISILRTIPNVLVDYYIVSAGFGVISENTIIPPYDCTFSGRSKTFIRERAESLDIPGDFLNICEQQYDFMYLALGKEYLISLGDDWKNSIGRTVVALFSKAERGVNFIQLPSDSNTVHLLSQKGHKIHGVVGLKGDLLRILAGMIIKEDNSYGELLGWLDTSYLEQLVWNLCH